MIIATFSNVEIGVKAEVHALNDSFEVAVTDLDSGREVGRQSMPNQDDAIGYARACASDVVPDGTLIPVTYVPKE